MGTALASTPDQRTPTRLPGLFLRPVRWPEEAPVITDLNNACREAVGNLDVLTVEGLRNHYDHLFHCDLADDLRLAEFDGRPVAYVRVEWEDERRGERAFIQALFVPPTAPPATLDAILDWSEARAAEIAGTLPADRPAMLSTFLGADTSHSYAVLEARGYHAVRFFFEMVRPDLEGIPDVPLPPGVEARPVREEDLRAVWRAEVEAFSEHWGSTDDDGREERWEEFRSEPLNDLSLWQVAWAGDQVVGMVRPFINPADHARFGAKLGWCENISTHADWRGRGIAKALIARALTALRDRGMTAAALGVDADNETGAVRLYRSMGFVERRRETDFRKALVPGVGL